MLKLDELDRAAWNELVKAKYVVQMHAARGHDIEKAAQDVADAGLRILGDGRYVARVVSATAMFRDPVNWLVKLNTGAVVLVDEAPRVGDRVLVRVNPAWTANGDAPGVLVEEILIRAT
jgi:hypothetical protein